MMEQSVVVITGATSGIGQLAAIEFAKQGFHLVLSARSDFKAKSAEELIKTAAPDATIDFFFGDLSLMKDVVRIGEEIRQKYPKIDVLVNNVGLHAFKQRITSEGFAEMIAVNYLAPWLLTQILQQSLINADNARIVNVASRAARNHGEFRVTEDLTDKSDFTAKESSKLYGKTKLLDIMFTGELARRLNATGVIVNAVCPGFNVTGLGRELKFSVPLSKILNMLHIGDPRKGAEIIFRLSVDKAYTGVTGGFFAARTGAPIEPVPPEEDISLQKQLWGVTENLLQQRGFNWRVKNG